MSQGEIEARLAEINQEMKKEGTIGEFFVSVKANGLDLQTGEVNSFEMYVEKDGHNQVIGLPSDGVQLELLFDSLPALAQQSNGDLGKFIQLIEKSLDS